NGAREVRTARPGPERDLLWKARKRAFGAAGRLAPSNITQDGVIPRTKLPQVLREIHAIVDRHGLRVANVFHAGDGNLHPLILFDERDPEQIRAVVSASTEILRACVAHEYALAERAPDALVEPATTEEVCALVALAAAEEWSTVVWGGATVIGMGPPPARYRLALATRRMPRVLAYEPDDMTVTVQGG